MRFDAVVEGTCEFFARCVYDVEPFGRGTKPWKRFTRGSDSQRLLETAQRVRLFEVFPDGEILPIVEAQGSSEVDYTVTINIDICYLSSDLQTMIGMRDYEAIRRKILSTSAGVAGYQFPTFLGGQWSESEDSKFKYLRIPVECRITVTE